MKRSSWLVVIIFPASIAAQTLPGPSFEIASVKANPSRAGIRGHSFPGDRFEARNVPVHDLILVAYGEPGHLLPETYVAGGPDWIQSERFDVSASAGGGGSATVAQKQLMLRRLLAERFKLVTHTERRTVPVYALVVARRDGGLGPRLRRAAIDCEAILALQPGYRERCIMSAPPSGELEFRGQTMHDLANALAMMLERPVLDETGLAGGFDGDATFNPEGLPGMPPAARGGGDVPALSTAIAEQLGLKLESRRAPVPVVVIDRIERPTSN